MKLISLDQPTAPPLDLPQKFRLELPFFITLNPPSPLGGEGAGVKGPAKLLENEYWIDLTDAQRWLDDGVVFVVSPLDAENKAEIELTEDHERFLEWLVKYNIQHVQIG